MVVGEMAEGIDFLVVGGGPGGYAAALRAAQLGREVVLVERDGAAGLGGTCVRVGCIPSKALIELAETRHRARSFEVAGPGGRSREIGPARFPAPKGGALASARSKLTLHAFRPGRAGSWRGCLTASRRCCDTNGSGSCRARRPSTSRTGSRWLCPMGTLPSSNFTAPWWRPGQYPWSSLCCPAMACVSSILPTYWLSPRCQRPSWSSAQATLESSWGRPWRNWD